jgi:hypothetical protein
MNGMMIVLRSAETLPLLSTAEITDQPCVEIGDPSARMPESQPAGMYMAVITHGNTGVRTIKMNKID